MAGARRGPDRDRPTFGRGLVALAVVAGVAAAVLARQVTGLSATPGVLVGLVVGVAVLFAVLVGGSFVWD